MLPVPFALGAAIAGLVSYASARRNDRRAGWSATQLAQLAGEAFERAGLQVLRVEPLRGGRAVDIHGHVHTRHGPVRVIVRAFAADRAREIDVENLEATAVIAGAELAVLVSKSFTRAARERERPGATVLLTYEDLPRIGAGRVPPRLRVGPEQRATS